MIIFTSILLFVSCIFVAFSIYMLFRNDKVYKKRINYLRRIDPILEKSRKTKRFPRKDQQFCDKILSFLDSVSYYQMMYDFFTPLSYYDDLLEKYIKGKITLDNFVK